MLHFNEVFIHWLSTTGTRATSEGHFTPGPFSAFFSSVTALLFNAFKLFRYCPERVHFYLKYSNFISISFYNEICTIRKHSYLNQT